MPNPTLRLHTAVLRLTVILSCWLRTYHAVLAADVTVQDTDLGIVYQPSTSWHSSSESCPNCLNPGGGITWHQAIHPALTKDADDFKPTSAAQNSPAATGEAPITSPQTPPTSASSNSGPGSTNSGSSNSGSNTSGSTPGSSGKKRRSIMRRVVEPREDADDPGFKDPDVTLSFNFTGHAISIFSTQPLGLAAATTNSTPTNMNLTFSLDEQHVGDFQNIGSPLSNGQFLQRKSIFSKADLEDTAHQLVIHVGQNSSFIFDYLIYSTNSTANDTSSAAPSPSLAAQMPSQTVNPKMKKHQVATFAGAVGGSVGVLALFSLGLAISIIRRRRLAAKRERHDTESLHTEATDDSPNMSGPSPFIPRFFPDTIIPADPPTYTAATNHNNSTLLAQLSPSQVYPDSERSYADMPPLSPPPAEEDTVLIPAVPPPPFPMAVTSVPSTTLAVIPEGEMPPSIPTSGAIPPSHILDSVGANRSNSALSPETVPLLQSMSDAVVPPPLPLLSPLPSRPASIASSISYDIHGNPINDPTDEDVSYGRGR